MSFMDKMKQKAEEFDLENKAKKLQEAATQAAHQAREKAGELATENRDKIDGAIGKASTAIDERTEGKYSDKIARAKEQINKGVDKVAEGDHPASDVTVDTDGADGTASGTASGSGEPLADPVTSADAPTQSGVTPSSVNPPEVSQPQAGHPAPGAVPGAVPGPPATAPKTPDQPTP